jgi:RNA polymerase sigma-70 factor, ECF subfamily
VGPEHLSAHTAAERVARTSYGRLLARLAASTGDIALAEDALSAALEEALCRWPDDGVPDNPEGWILTVARNRQRDTWKSAARRTGRPLEHAEHEPTREITPDDLDLDAVGERRLELMLVCAHPAIDPSVRAPLMLQSVLGIEAARIARVFVVPDAAMAQRLVRAKKRIRTNRVPFVVPDRSVLADRLPALLEAIYGCLAATWDDDAPAGDSLAGEAHHLAVTLAALLGDEPEAWALAALATFTLSRARPAGTPYVPLDEQDPADWDAGLMDEARSYLRRAHTPDPPGRFQLEAAVGAVHADRARTGTLDLTALHTLYDALVLVAPTLGARVARASVIARIDGPDAALTLLDEISAESFQPWHATRADLLRAAACAKPPPPTTGQPSSRRMPTSPRSSDVPPPRATPPAREAGPGRCPGAHTISVHAPSLDG